MRIVNFQSISKPPGQLTPAPKALGLQPGPGGDKPEEPEQRSSSIVDCAYGTYRGISAGASPGIMGVLATSATRWAQATSGPLGGLLVGGVTGAMLGITVSRAASAALGRSAQPSVDRALALTFGLANAIAGAGGGIELGPEPAFALMALGGGIIGGVSGASRKPNAE